MKDLEHGDSHEPQEWWFKPLYNALARHKNGNPSEYDEAVQAAYGGGFHWRHNVFFKRLDDGTVRVRHWTDFNGTPQWVDWVIPAPEWASIVCSVSAEGETRERWDAAQDFHGREKS